MREISCPGCGEVLGVPRELEGGAIRCGVCERVIEPHEQGRPAPRSRADDRDDRRGDSDRPRSRDDERDRDRTDDEDRPRRPRRTSRDADDDFDRPKKKSGCGVWIWILGIVGVLILGCCGGGGFLLYKFAGDPKWEKFSPPDGRWSAEFPGQPIPARITLYTGPSAGVRATIPRRWRIPPGNGNHRSEMSAMVIFVRTP